MSSASSAQLIEAALASVEDRVQQQIEAARQRRERDRQQRAELAAARQAGVARRHAARLRNQRGADDHTDDSQTDPQAAAHGDRSAVRRAHSRAGGSASEGTRS